MSIVISTIYWNLLLFMPHMILMADPEETTPTSSSQVSGPARLSLPVDLALHAAPAIAMFIDFYFFEPRYSKSVSRRGSIALAALSGSWYSWWVERCASYNGFCKYFALLAHHVNTNLDVLASPVPIPDREPLQHPSPHLYRGDRIFGSVLYGPERPTSLAPFHSHTTLSSCSPCTSKRRCL